MSEHYYSEKPLSNHVTQTWSDDLLGHSFTFTSGAGVFSKGNVDFGTKTLIDTFVAPEVEGKLLDLGCGYGPIGITLAHHFPERQVVMVDVNERAILLAKENAERNNVNNVAISQGNGLRHVADTFASILTNPPIRAGKEVVFRFYRESEALLVSGGELWVVIQKKQGAPSTLKYLETLFPFVEVRNKARGYFIIRARKD